jgi:hypothetical protein
MLKLTLVPCKLQVIEDRELFHCKSPVYERALESPCVPWPIMANLPEIPLDPPGCSVPVKESPLDKVEPYRERYEHDEPSNSLGQM